MESIAKLIGIVVGALLILTVAVLLFMWAWNGFAVVVFGLPTINVITAFWGVVLTSFICAAWTNSK